MNIMNEYNKYNEPCEYNKLYNMNTINYVRRI